MRASTARTITTPNAETRRGSTGPLHAALWLLVASVCINYIDRGNLSVAGVAVQKEFHLTATQLGWLLSGFFWTYAAFQIPAGWLIDRLNVVWVYAGGFLLWSTATALTGVATGFETMFILRLLLGIGESASYPAYSKIIAAGFPEERRGIANGLIDAGSKLGPAFGVLICGAILAALGWRAVFLIIGLTSLLWLIPWSIIARKLTVVAEVASEGECAPGIRDIARHREAWGTFLGLFCSNYGWYFMVTWLPQYFMIQRHYSAATMARLGSLPFWFVAFGAVLGGWAADRLVERCGNPTLVRKSFVGGGLILFAVLFMPAVLVENEAVALPILLTASFCMGLFSANVWTITQRLAGPLAAGKWTGMQNCSGNLAGIVVPVVTGRILDATGRFELAFASVCAVVLIGAFSFLVIVRKVEPLRF
jgi:MFS family permease